MTEAVPQDNPIVRATVAMLTNEQLVALVQAKRDRRLRLHRIYEQGVQLKQELRDEKDRALVQKKLSQFEKQLESVDKGIEKLDKFAIEIQALRLALGEED